MIVSVPCGEAWRIVSENGAGEYVSPDDPRALADCVAALADDRVRLASLAKASAQAASRYDRILLARTMLDILAEAAGRAS